MNRIDKLIQSHIRERSSCKLSAKKILIIDDDEHLLVGLSAKLKANGYSVVSAMDGGEPP